MARSAITSHLEGFDKLVRVGVESNGEAVWVEFLSKAVYRLPAPFRQQWARIGGAEDTVRVRAARRGSKGRRMLVTFASGLEHEFGAETILLNCEPMYRADDERDGQREFLNEGLRAYGYLGREGWLS